MTVHELTDILNDLPKDAEIICGESPITIWITSEKDGEAFFDMMFIGIKGSSLIPVKVNKPLSFKVANFISDQNRTFTELNRLNGIEYEEAFAKLTPWEREEYLRMPRSPLFVRVINRVKHLFVNQTKESI